MLPLRLRIKGLYSYLEEQEIDFEKLTKSGLFGIFGPVGSGKSSILEAIIFAIYDNTERLNAMEQRSYNMMNLKSDEMIIDFECLAGINAEIRYRFLVNYRRNKKDRRNIIKGKRQIYKYLDNEWKPVAEEPKDIIGLNYDNFRKTVIIPQGQFSEFLHSGGKDRRIALMEIFQLERFDLSDNISVLEKANNAELHQLSGLMAPLMELGLENLEAEKEDLTRIIAVESIKSLELDAKKAQEGMMLNIKKLYDNLQAQTRNMAGLENQSARFKEKEEFLKKYNAAMLFRDLFENRKKQEQILISQKLNLDKKAVQLRENEEKQLKISVEFVTAKEKYEDREKLKNKAAGLGRLIRLQALEKEWAGFNAQIEDQKVEKDKNELSINHLKVKLTELQTQEQTIMLVLPDPIVLSGINAWFYERNQFNDRIAGLEKDKSLGEIAIDNLLAEKDTFMAQKEIQEALMAAGILYNSDEKDTAGILEKARIFFQHEIPLKEKQWQQKLLGDSLTVYQKELMPGEPCPLCGSLEHPVHETPVIDNEDQLPLLKSQLEKLRFSLTCINDAMGQIMALRKQYKYLKDKKEEQELAILTKTSELTAHDNKWRWDNYDKGNPARIKEDTDNYELLTKKLDGVRKAVEHLRADHDSAIKQSSILNEKIAEAGTHLTRAQTEIALLKAEDNEEDYLMFDNKNEIELKAEAERLLKMYDEAEWVYKKIETGLHEINNTLADARGAISQMSKQAEMLEEQLEESDIEIQKRLQYSIFTHLEEIQGLLVKTIDTAAEEKHLLDYNNALSLARELVREYSAELEGKTFDEEAYNGLVSEIEALKIEGNGLKEDIGRKKELIQRFENQLELKARLESQIKHYEDRRQNIGTLRELFKGKGFVDYISSVYLSHLCQAANARFGKLTRQSLSLVLTDDNQFEIADLLNGGLRRHIKTLSGGQTFQAALSLALALADSTQKMAGNRQNFFFLDEGFGSLDKDSLQTVLETLKALQKENRIVGVISHLEELQQEINVSLSVINDTERGSTIKYSWEA